MPCRAVLCWHALPHLPACSQAPAAPTGRRSYSLRAASKSVVQQYFFMSQLPSVFAFVSPMITYFALGITVSLLVFLSFYYCFSKTLHGRGCRTLHSCACSFALPSVCSSTQRVPHGRTWRFPEAASCRVI